MADADVLSTTPPTLAVVAIPTLIDNYVWLFRCEDDPGAAVVVDPGEAAPVAAALEKDGLRLSHILLTHHHFDHVGGVDDLRGRYGAAVVGAARDAGRLPRLDRALEDDDAFDVGDIPVRVLAVPGHTTGHVAYVARDVVFAGDALFSFGCGRLFEGTPDEMWRSLVALRDQPDGMRVCCGHEYTASNLRFARSLEPESASLQVVAAEVETLRDAGEPTLPCLLDREKALNPFLRCDDIDFVRGLGLLDKDPAEVFAVIRARKDAFGG